MANMARLLMSCPRWVMACCALWVCSNLVHAQTAPMGVATVSGQAISTVVDNERLSDWLLRQSAADQAYTTALMWQFPAEKNVQSQLKQDLLSEIAASNGFSPFEKSQWLTFLNSLAVTGRVGISIPDARWLQAHPGQDPVLDRSHVLALPKRVDKVSVLSHEGALCTVAHAPGAQASHYLRACGGVASIAQAHWAWVIQPDGFVQKVGVKLWNLHQQPELAPGALIWAPGSERHVSDRLSELLPAFLATQTYDALLGAPGLMHSNGAAIDAKPLANQARSLPVTFNDWGLVGLLQTPTARMQEAGHMRFNFSSVYPYDRYNVFVQPFDFLEAGFRYTDVKNRLYGSASLSGSQTYKDKGIDFKARLVKETAVLPQVALGMIDFGGTGLFSSEYLVSNKRFGDFDASLGVAWGYLGASGNIPNPLSKLSASFETRPTELAGMGGIPALKSFFRGPAALFGGVQYHAPWSNWVIKAEYDGNNYRNEPQGNNQKQTLPINFGVVYRPNPSVDLSIGVERGNTAMLALTLHTSASRLGNPKVSDPVAPKVTALWPQRDPDWTGTAADIVAVSKWGVIDIRRAGPTLRVQMEGASGAYWNERIDRIISVLHRDAPYDIETFELLLTEQGVRLSERVIQRQTWVTQSTQFVPPSSRVLSVLPVDPATNALKTEEVKVWSQTPSNFGYSIMPSWQQNLGGPDGFLLFRAGAVVPMQWRLAKDVRLTATLNVNAFDNFDKFKYTAPSAMPRVRTYMREYMTNSRLNLTSLQLTHFGELASNHYYSVYGGYLESMFAGVGGEWMYRPWHSPLAFGVDINRVQQRNFDQSFGFSNAGTQTGYQVTTGHASAYWDTGWRDTRVKISAGRYLAGDVGATFDVSKVFDNGVSMGVWLTKTNVSAAIFGEGSFDKGLYLKIPFDAMATTRTSGTANLVYSFLTRDGGARLNREFTLYGETTARSRRDTNHVPSPVKLQ